TFRQPAVQELEKLTNGAGQVFRQTLPGERRQMIDEHAEQAPRSAAEKAEADGPRRAGPAAVAGRAGQLHRWGRRDLQLLLGLLGAGRLLLQASHDSAR